MRLISACLLGIRCRHDGRSKANKKVIELAKKEALIPVCPEQLGGASTPREQTELKSGKAITVSGKDVTVILEKGAEEVIRLTKQLGIKEAILKQRSPSCGAGQIYDGTFKGKIINGNGITAGQLLKSGIKIITEEDL